jgi:hypothetical protein
LAHASLASGELTVLAVFARSLYAVSGDGNVLCLCDADLPLGPFSVACGQWGRVIAQNPHAGDTITVSGAGEITLGLLRIVTESARIWVPDQARFPPSDCADGLARLSAHAFPFKEGLSDLLPWVLGGALPVSQSPTVNALLGIGKQGVEALEAWLRSAEPLPSPRDFSLSSLTRLIGLGPGLTPSGDDLLGGVLLGLRFLGRQDLAEDLASVILPVAQDNTNVISHAYLRAAAKGMGARVLHDAMHAVRRNPPGLFTVLRHLDEMGHSSGWDAFLGVLCVYKYSQ